MTKSIGIEAQCDITGHSFVKNGPLLVKRMSDILPWKPASLSRPDNQFVQFGLEAGDLFFQYRQLISREH